jgi:predicted protein tyrosine phosphatase
METLFNGMTMRLSICGLHDLHELRSANVSHVVSILDPDVGADELFRPSAMHERLELRFHDVIDDEENRVSPQPADIARLLEFGCAIGKNGHAAGHLLVYCHAGLSRSTAAMVLLLAQALRPQPVEMAVERMLEIRPNAWPNLRMSEIGDTMLGCNGRLVAAVRRHYDDMIKRYPELGRAISRGRHLPGGRRQI